jgi:hypothetical protein
MEHLVSSPTPGQSPRDQLFSLARWRPVAVDDLVRVGRAHDGGYVISRRCIEATKVLVGMGINDDWSFERDFVERSPAVRVIGLDGSVSDEIFHGRAGQAATLAIGYFLRLKRWLMTEQRQEAARWRERARGFREFFGAENRVFYRKFVSDVDDDAHVTWSSLRRLEPALTRDEALPAVFVKVDIERSEYRVLTDVLQDAARINGLAIEFHECDILWERFAELMDRLQERFAVVHIHGNNWARLIPGTTCPTTLEVSLVNRALLPATLSPSSRAYPIAGLDMPNNRERDDYRLTF